MAPFTVLLAIAAILGCAESDTSPATGTTFYTSRAPAAERTSPVPTDAPLVYACQKRITKRHTCRHDCDLLPWMRIAYCQCDPLCTTYGDCCHDYEEFCGQQTNDGAGSTVSQGDEMESKNEYTECVQTIDTDPRTTRPRRGHILMAICPSDWSGDPAIREMCHGPAGSDGLAAIPVEGPGGRHYKNVYCALCHGVPVGDVSFWSVSYVELEPGDFNFLNVSVLLKNAGQSFAALREFNPPGFVSRTDYSVDLETSSLRACVLLDPVTCPSSPPDIQALCAQHLAPIRIDGKSYRNLACYQCNQSAILSSIDLRRNCEFMNEQWERLSLWTPMSVATLLIYSDRTNVNGLTASGGSIVGSSSCTENQIYDPYNDLCRDLTCPRGFRLENGMRCPRLQKSDPIHPPVNVKVSLTVTGSFNDETDGQIAEEMWEEVASKAAGDYLSTISVCTRNDADEKNVTYCENQSLTWACTMGNVFLTNVQACGAGFVFACVVNVSFDGTKASTEHLTEESKMSTGKCFQAGAWTHMIAIDNFIISGVCSEYPNKTEDSDDGLETVSVSRLIYFFDVVSGNFSVGENVSCFDLACPLLTISKEDFVMSGHLNDSVNLTHFDRVLKRHEFRLTGNGDAEICNFLPAVNSAADDFWNKLQIGLTVSGSSLSLTGVVVTFATYVAFPTLRRNAAGKSVMCLVSTLFFAQLAIMIGSDRTDDFALCVTFAISSHYFWLSAVFWMNTLAIDIYRTFGIGTNINDPNTRSVLYYALYGLGTPAVIVGVCAFLSFCDCVDLDVHYASEHACWIGGGMTNLVTFGVPVIAVLCSNAVLFSLTVAGVMKTRRASEKMNVTQGQGDAASRSRTDLILYLKLTTIMGITWIFGFVASFTGIQLFWYPFIVLNSIQVALVCLAFVCNERVLTMWKEKLTGGDGQPTSSRLSNTQHTNVQQNTSG